MDRIIVAIFVDPGQAQFATDAMKEAGIDADVFHLLLGDKMAVGESHLSVPMDQKTAALDLLAEFGCDAEVERAIAAASEPEIPLTPNAPSIVTKPYDWLPSYATLARLAPLIFAVALLVLGLGYVVYRNL